MKKIVLFISIVVASAFFSANTSAQGKYGADSAECLKYLSFYIESYKIKNYDSALPSWRKAYSLCPPTLRYTLLTDGQFLLKKEMSKTTTSPARKKEIIDSIMTIYDQRIELWPKYRVPSVNNKAMDMYNYMKNDPMASYKALSSAIDINGAKTDLKIFKNHFNLACNLYNQGSLDADQVMADFQKDIDILSNYPAKNEIDKKLIEKNISDIESLLINSGIADCNNLLTLFTPRFDAAPDDLALAKTIVKMLQITGDCVDNDLYLNAVNTIYKQEPSHKSAYFLFRLYASRNDIDNAIRFAEEAINYEDSDAETDAGYWYELASVCFNNGKNLKAYEAANKAVDMSDAYDGKAYLLLGQIWSSAPCGGEIGSRAKFWVATDFMIKAKNADASLTEAANKAIGQYSAYYPPTADAFMYNISPGQGYTVSCGGMRASTTVRTR